MIPQTVEEWLSAPVFYSPADCTPIVNSAGGSLILESGWSTSHEFELSGANASRAFDLLERAGQWSQKRWGWLSRLLWPGRESVAGQSCWPDVVNQVSELARDATLPKPKWSVIVGKYRSSWPVEMWKRRDEFTLGEPQYTPEDVERIGEDPEVVLASRKHWLRDSETALEWLANKFKNQEQPIAPVVVPADASGLINGLSPDGFTLRWGGVCTPLSPTSSRLVKVLVDEFNKGFLYLHEEYLKTEGEFESDVRHIVRDSKLESIVVREVGADGKTIKGKWGLIDPKKVLPPQ